MLRLYGFAASNYFNIVKHTLLAKGIPYEEVTVYPSRDSEYLAKSPQGKVPCIETESGFLSETSVILDYLEEACPGTPSFYPQAPFARAKARQVMKISELYIELPARRHLPEILTGTPRLEEAFREAQPTMKKGLHALDQLVRCNPYLCGDQLGNADIFVRYALGIGKLVGRKIYEWDILADYEKLKNWDAMLARDPISQKVDAERDAAMEAFMRYIKSV